MEKLKPIELSEMIGTLRDELLAAQKQGEDRGIRFDVELAEIEVQFAVSRETNGGGKIKLHVIEAGGEARFSKEVVQKVTLQLKPKDAQSGGTAKLTG